MLESERVCSKHFVFGEPAPDWDQFHADWVPNVALGKKKYVEKDHENAAERALRAKKRRQQAIKRAKLEAAEKKRVDESGVPFAKMDFSEPTSSACEVEQHSEGLETVSIALELDGVYKLDKNTTPENPLLHDLNTDSIEARQHTASPVWKEATTSDSSCLIDEFEYNMLLRKGYQAPTRDFFDSDSKVLFYMKLTSLEILMVVFEHVSPYVTRKILSLDRFQEFVITLMKLRLNMPLQDLAYHFKVSHSTASQIFSSWPVVIDTRLFPLIS